MHNQFYLKNDLKRGIYQADIRGVALPMEWEYRDPNSKWTICTLKVDVSPRDVQNIQDVGQFYMDLDFSEVPDLVKALNDAYTKWRVKQEEMKKDGTNQETH